MNLNKIGFVFILAALLVSCNRSNTSKDGANRKDELESAAYIGSKKEFPLVKIPEIINSQNDRIVYMVTHYWDNFDFADTSYIHVPDITIQAFANYLGLFSYVDDALVEESMYKMLDASVEQDSTKRMYSYFLDLYRDYLYEADSPLREDEYYLFVTKYILSDSVSDLAVKERAGFDQKMMLKNRKGEKANNFSFITAQGGQSSLYDLGKDYTLLYFYNPDCNVCAEVADFLKRTLFVRSLLERDVLDILAIYPDVDASDWKAHVDKIPDSWINGHDDKQLINTKLLYDLKAIPTLYLLDKEKKVLLKDASAESIVQYLRKEVKM